MHRVEVAATPETLWASLQKPESWARIGGVSKVDQPSFDANGEVTGYRFTVELGGNSHTGSATRAAAEPPRRLSMKLESDQLGGQIEVELEPAGDIPDSRRTAITVSMTVQSKGMMTAMLFPVISGAIASGFNESVEQFAEGLVGRPAGLEDGPTDSAGLSP
jgi:carbon monoxide dehydrogenase subunit G